MRLLLPSTKGIFKFTKSFVRLFSKDSILREHQGLKRLGKYPPFFGNIYENFFSIINRRIKKGKKFIKNTEFYRLIIFENTSVLYRLKDEELGFKIGYKCVKRQTRLNVMLLNSLSYCISEQNSMKNSMIKIYIK